jgi:hypothetical protein
MKCLKCNEESVSRETCSSCGASLKDQIQEMIKELNKKGKNKKGVIKTLGTTKDLRVVVPILEIAMKDEDIECRIEAIEALAELQDRDVVDALMKSLLKDKMPEIRGAAAETIGRLKGHKAKDELIKTLDDNVPEVKIKVLKALEELATKDCINAMARMLTEQDPRVERAALEGLQRLGYEIKWDGDRVAEVKLKPAGKPKIIMPVIFVLLIAIAGFFLYKSANPEKKYVSGVENIIKNCELISKEFFSLNQELEKSNLEQTKIGQINVKSSGIEGKFRNIRNGLNSLKPPPAYEDIHKELGKILDIYVLRSRGLVSESLYIDFKKNIDDNYKMIDECEARVVEVKSKVKKMKSEK